MCRVKPESHFLEVFWVAQLHWGYIINVTFFELVLTWYAITCSEHNILTPVMSEKELKLRRELMQSLAKNSRYFFSNWLHLWYTYTNTQTSYNRPYLVLS